jgi:Protein of unknown function (DUF3617)
MKNARLVALACCAASSLALAAGNPFDSFKGKMKEGMYEYKMDMDMGAMPGMPPGMGKQSHTFQKCITSQDIEKGQMGRGERNGKPPESCEIKNFSQSGNTASYTMVCKDPPMSADNRITFKSDGFTMDMKMAMSQRGGREMNMTQHMESKYLGPCK